MKTSVTSVTFRSLGIQEIAILAHEAQLDAVEWGGDVHVKPGDQHAAVSARQACHELGLEISAYGSYYQAREDEPFLPVLETALQLNAPVIRVWAGDIASAVCSEEDRKRISERLSDAVYLAKRAGCIVATESHINTLTDDLSSTLRLLQDVPGLLTYWQPPLGNTKEENLFSLDQLEGRIQNVHVYQWNSEYERFPLSDGKEEWLSYLRAVERHPLPRYATLEFVKNNSKAQFIQDAATLRHLVSSIK